MPAPAAPPPINDTYPVYGDVGIPESATPEPDPTPDVASTTSTRRYATYNAAATRSSGGLAAILVIGLIMLVVFIFVAQLIFRSFTDSTEFGDQGVPSDFPTEIMEDPGFLDSFE